MIGTFTIGRKAAKYGYRKFGIPGAIAGIVAVLVGRKWLKSYLSKQSETDASSSGGSVEALLDDATASGSKK